jgi:NAD(P)-dependent dehydrogenase (short-subunit alcohol dehydrogenase family)
MSVILITGCSSGFGMLAAARLAAGNHQVYATMRDLNKKIALLEEADRRGSELSVLQLDVTDKASIRSAIQHIEKNVGRLDILINNAGYGIGGFFEDLTEEEIRSQFETNFFGVQNVTRAALPLLRKTASQPERAGLVKIINVSSIQGRSALPGMSAYAASKFSLEGFSESLALELAPLGIHVSLVEPGGFRTKIFTDNVRMAAGSTDPDSAYFVYSQHIKRRADQVIVSSVTTGDPEKVAQLIEKIIDRPRPRLRYLIGNFARLRLLMIRVLPWRWYSTIVRRIAYGKSERKTGSV